MDIVRILNQIKADDDKFEEENNGTFCCECRNHTFVGSYPFWHRFRRSLCDACGREYTKFLKDIGAWPE
jgi:hypothetical protein